MEEKERYEVMFPSLNGYAYIHDFKTDNVLNTYDSCDLLNKQDKENQQLNSIIEKFEEENGYVLFEDGYDENGNEIHKQKYVTYKSKCDELRKENQQLKQQLHDLPKKVVGEVEKNFTEYLPLKYKTGAGFYSRLNAILKKYGGEDE